MIRNLPHAAGYTDSKGLFAPRKAVVHYTQEKHIAGVTVDDVYLGNGASELIAMSMNALLDDGDEVLIPSPDYPLWTAVVALSGGTPVHYLCDEGRPAGCPTWTTSARKITPRTKASSSSTRTTRPARCTPTTCCARSSRSRASTS
jgi:alanine-synthesizing transaminase